MLKKLLIAALGCALTASAFSETAGFQASLTPDIAVEDRDTRINGISLNIWGENPQSGFALGILNSASGESYGLMLGIVNYAENYTGAQLGFLNYTRGELIGLQAGWNFFAVNYAGKLTGVQLGLVNYAETVHNGLQIGLVNIMPENEWFDDFPNDLAKGMVIVNWSFGAK